MNHFIHCTNYVLLISIILSLYLDNYCCHERHKRAVNDTNSNMTNGNNNSTITKPCTYTQLYWSNNFIIENKWPSLSKVYTSIFNITLNSSIGYNTNTTPTEISPTLCGITWKKLLIIDSIKMAIADNMYWMVTFHQYATIILNILWIQENQLPNFTVNNDIIQAILFIG